MFEDPGGWAGLVKNIQGPSRPPIERCLSSFILYVWMEFGGFMSSVGNFGISVDTGTFFAVMERGRIACIIQNLVFAPLISLE